MPTITLITGANQGIGLATATRLAKEHGHHVIIGSRDAHAGTRVAESLKTEGYAASSVQLDLSSDDSITAAFSAIDTKFGKLDVLVNNAAVLLDGKDAAPPSVRELLTQTFATNVTGTACLTETMLPLLRKSNCSRLIFVSSRMGSLAQATIRDTPFFATDYKAYDASKAALNILALNYARILEGCRYSCQCRLPWLGEHELDQSFALWCGASLGLSAHYGAGSSGVRRSACNFLRQRR